MGRIQEFEQQLVENGLTDDDFSEYGKLLKRVGSNFLRRQHCYTTAIQFPEERLEQAIKLIQYGLDRFEDDWFSTYTSYLHMGKLCERAGAYKRAYEYYYMARNALGPEHEEYEKFLSINLMWMKLHIDSFCYSTEAEEYYSCFTKTDDFLKSFVNNEFKMNVARTVISLRYGNTDEARNALESAKKMCIAGYKGKLHDILLRHRYQEKVDTTPEALTFIKSLKV